MKKLLVLLFLVFISVCILRAVEDPRQCSLTCPNQVTISEDGCAGCLFDQEEPYTWFKCYKNGEWITKYCPD